MKCILYIINCLFLLSAGEMGGFRDVQIRSDEIITVWLGYHSVTQMSLLKNKMLYTISSNDDPEFSMGCNPLAILRFAKGSQAPKAWAGTDLMDNLMHCQLPAKLKPGKSYTVTLGSGLIPPAYNHSMAFSLDETPNPSFKLNQVGYSARADVKHVYLSSYLGDGLPVELDKYTTFEVRRTGDHSTVFSGPIVLVSEEDDQGRDQLYRLDISALREEGQFYIYVSGLGRSYSFLNGNMAAQKIHQIIGRGLYFQRSGTAVVPPFGEDWVRPMAHNKIYVTDKNIVHPWTEGYGDRVINPDDPGAGDWYVPDGPREVHGGHYDAGDFDLRLTHVGVAEKLMSLYEALPERFYDRQINIPEAGNGIPDILDEAAWSLLAWEYCQDYAREVRGLDGGVAPGMESYRHPPVVAGTGDKDPLPYWMRKVTPYSSFAGAGLFAQAARVFAKFDQQRAAKYLERALVAYNYAVLHRMERWEPEIAYIGAEESYNQESLNGAWCWAAGELLATTGEEKYWNDFLSTYTTMADNIFWNFDRWIILWPVISVKQPVINKGFQNQLQAELLAAADGTVSEVLQNGRSGYQAACPGQGGWGSASPLHTNNIGAVIRGYLLTKRQNYLDIIATGIDFVLGMNPSEISWMTGAGTVYVMDPLNINCKYDGVEQPHPGIVIFGPTQNYQNEHNLLYPDPEDMGFYRRIADIWTFVEGCEYVVDQQQAGMYLAIGCLLPEGEGSSVGDTDDTGSGFFVNSSPNPFKERAEIHFVVQRDNRIALNIYNLNGQKIINLVDRAYEAGQHSVTWLGKNQDGTSVANGLYICTLHSGNDHDAMKLILLR